VPVIGFAPGLVFKPPLDGFGSYLLTLYLVSSAKGRGTGRRFCVLSRRR
jgi:hypothetical protein